MIPSGKVSLGDCRTEFGLSGSIGLNSDLLRFRGLKGKGGQMPLSSVRGTLTSELKTINSTYTSGSSSRATMQKVQTTKYDPGNIVNTTSTKTEWLTENNARSPNGGYIRTTIVRKTQGSDVSMGQNYWGYAPDGGGNFKVDFFHSASDVTQCRTDIEIFAWSNGWLQGSVEELLPETTISSGNCSYSFSCNGTKKYITVLLQCITLKDKYYTQQYQSNIHGLRCYKV